MAGSIDITTSLTGTDLIVAADLTTFRLASTDSTRIAQAISAASELVESYCDRTFSSTAYAEWIKAEGDTLRLSEYPLVDGTAVVIRAPMDAVTLTLSSSTRKFNSILVDKTKLHLDANGSRTSLTLASYNTMALLVAALSSPWSGEVVYEDSPATLKPCAVPMGDTNSVATLECAGELATDYDVLEDIGRIDLGKRCTGWYYCSYTAGYASLPADLKQVVVQLTADLCESQAANPLLTKESLGDYSYELKATGASFLAPYTEALNKYRRVGL